MDDISPEFNEKEYKIVVLGNGGVGKSSLTIRLVTEDFLEEYDPTIEDSYRKPAIVDGENALLDILDTAGQEEYTSMQDQWMREGKGFMLVYSITNRSTFDNIRSFKDRILRAQDADEVPIVLVGNKCDLNQFRQVSEAQGRELAKEWNCPFMETSAKEQIRNEDCFYQVVREIRRFEAPVSAQIPPPATRDTKEKKKKKFCCVIL